MSDCTKSHELTELSLLFDISIKLSDTLDLKAALKPILRMTAEHMEIPRGTLTILNRNRGEIVIEEAYGLRPEEQAKGKYHIGEGITGKVIDTGKAIAVPRISEEPLFLDRTGAREHLDKSDIAFICVPVKIGSETIGALSADRSSRETSALEADMRLLTIIASTISQAAPPAPARPGGDGKGAAGKPAPPGSVEGPVPPQGHRRQLEDHERRLRAHRNGQPRRIRPFSSSGKAAWGRNGWPMPSITARRAPTNPLSRSIARPFPNPSSKASFSVMKKGPSRARPMARKGRFEMADRGTIFLDEIGELSLSVQTKLLRVIQEREFERIGGNTTIKSDVRIIAATNRDLATSIREGKFREDLYYRLNVFPIVVPPLRERRTDIMLLADHFVQKYAREHGKKIDSISTSATDRLMNYHWPGNVRELENCIERAVILCADGNIRSHHLPPNLQTVDAAAHDLPVTFKGTMAGMEKEIIIDELKRSRGNMAKAARALGITERMIGLRVAKYGIDPGRFK